MQAPRNKREFYDRWLKLEFGNRPRCWATLDELTASGFQGKFSIRSRIPGGKLATQQRLGDKDHPTQDVVYQESLPDHLLVIQASLGRDEQHGLWIEYCLDKDVHFRQAMAQSQFKTGLKAVLVLQEFVDPASLQDLYQLMDTYPDGVIEFATFSQPLGVLPGRRTVIFELRAY